MNIKKYFLTAILIVSPVLAKSNNQTIRIGIMDFSSTTTSPSYKNLGIGMSQMYMTGLNKIQGILIVNRQREDLLKVFDEIALGQTGLIDEETAVEAGNMLGANFLLLGSFTEVNSQININIRLIDVENNTIVLTDEKEGNINDYFKIIKESRKKIIVQIEKMKEVSLKLEDIYQPKINSLVALSDGIKAQDEGDETEAKKQYQNAINQDPEFKLAKIFLDKLVLNTSKFKTIYEQYYPNTNPAYLGIIHYDKLYSSFSMTDSPLPWLSGPQWKDLGENNAEFYQADRSFIYGYEFPVSDDLGFGVEAFISGFTDAVRFKGDETGASNINTFYGAKLSSGWKTNDNFGLGGSVSVLLHEKQGFDMAGDAFSVIPNEGTSTEFAGTIGFLIKNKKSTVMFDSLVGFTNIGINVINPELQTVIYDAITFPDIYIYEDSSAKEPIYNENTFTMAFFNKKAFGVVKEVNTIYTDRDYFVARLIPAVEFWAFDSLSLRIGAEGSYHKFASGSEFGIGGTAASTLRFLSEGIEFDYNATYRKRPARTFKNKNLNQFVFVFSVSKQNIFLSR
ncbi:MAG: CsgG/HfaB family protein [Spirochaetia bacterium]|nr:CsgG/HfaB family protein [Spirochaetia bacterium]